MDTYRLLHETPPNCATRKYLREILDKRQPPIDGGSRTTVDRMQEIDRISFFPSSAMNKIFQPEGGQNPVRSILECSCELCRKVRGNKIERELLTKRIVDKPLTVLLAILIYIGYSHLISLLAPHDRITDNSLDSVAEFIKTKEEDGKWQKLLKPHGIKDFCEFFKSARDLFQPPRFIVGGPTTVCNPTERMPYLDDQVHVKGSSGKVWKFNIHEDYVDENIKSEKWYFRRTKVSISTP